jgi:hypothetical protein
MCKYFLFLLVNIVFIFLLASTYWQLIQDLAESPAKVPEKLAMVLQQGHAKHFFLLYVILQGESVKVVGIKTFWCAQQQSCCADTI